VARDDAAKAEVSREKAKDGRCRVRDLRVRAGRGDARASGAGSRRARTCEVHHREVLLRAPAVRPEVDVLAEQLDRRRARQRHIGGRRGGALPQRGRHRVRISAVRGDDDLLGGAVGARVVHVHGVVVLNARRRQARGRHRRHRARPAPVASGWTQARVFFPAPRGSRFCASAAVPRAGREGSDHARPLRGAFECARGSGPERSSRVRRRRRAGEQWRGVFVTFAKYLLERFQISRVETKYRSEPGRHKPWFWSQPRLLRDSLTLAPASFQVTF
jgi:hypothetical protein